ncbi:universal stress protein [Gymnodinialimonas sp. 57CJ19]|uniref:universal stress protein n=1 Tax=Gymnodinialimonas sp. 57CJ19 TaxID=3138498 RepID=UPI003134285B
MRNIVVGIDLSARSDRAIDRAANLARQFSAALHIVHVIDDELPKSVVDLQRDSVKALLTRQTAKQDAFTNIDTNIHLLLGDPSTAILTFAEQQSADLIVLGTQRALGLLERFRGTTVARIAAASQIPTLVVAAPVCGAYERPVVGVDFSVCSGNAARLAAKLAADQKLTLVNAYHIPFKMLTANTTASGEVSMKDAQRAEAELKEPMAAFENDLAIAEPVEWVLVEGHPTAVLQQTTRRMGADLVSVGPHARSWLSKALIGSTAEDLLTEPPCDVLVTPL